MMKERIIVQFRGFHPSEFTQAHIESLMKDLQAEAPQGATLKAVFSRRDFYFRGVISIQSSAGRFFSVSSGRKVREVTGELSQKMRRQLHRWKSERIRKNRRHIEDGRSARRWNDFHSGTDVVA